MIKNLHYITTDDGIQVGISMELMTSSLQNLNQIVIDEHFIIISCNITNVGNSLDIIDDKHKKRPIYSMITKQNQDRYIAQIIIKSHGKYF